MKKHIYLLTLLCSITVFYPLFAGGEKNIKEHVIKLIKKVIQREQNATAALKHILNKAPRGSSIDRGWAATFVLMYPRWQELYTKSPEEFRHLFE